MTLTASVVSAGKARAGTALVGAILAGTASNGSIRLAVRERWRCS